MGTSSRKGSGTQDTLGLPSAAVVDVPEKIEPQYASSDEAKSSDGSDKVVEKEKEGSMKDFFVSDANHLANGNVNSRLTARFHVYKHP